jgi:ADP-heptose:LPS heptosyltransferase
MSRSRLLAIRGGALGDFLATLPAILSIKRAHDADLSLLTRPAYGELCRHFEICEEWKSLDSADAAALYSIVSPANVLTHWIAGFDAVAAWCPPRDTEFIAALTACSASPKFFFPSIVDSYSDVPAFRQLGGDGAFESVLYRPSQKPLPQIAIHPGSGGQDKNWSLDRWLALLGHPCWEGLSFLIPAGEVEMQQPHFASFCEAARRVSPGCQFLVDQPLSVVAEALNRCVAYVGNDSGISHLANACGVPSLVLFGPSNPAVWAPPGAHVLRASDARITSIRVEDVASRMLQLLAAWGVKLR